MQQISQNISTFVRNMFLMEAVTNWTVANKLWYSHAAIMGSAWVSCKSINKSLCKNYLADLIFKCIVSNHSLHKWLHHRFMYLRHQRRFCVKLLIEKLSLAWHWDNHVTQIRNIFVYLDFYDFLRMRLWKWA